MGLIFIFAKPSAGFYDMLFVALALFMALVISLIDLDWRIIPDSLSIAWLGLTLLFAPWNPVMFGYGWEDAYVQAILGAAAAACVVWMTLWSGHLIKKRDVMGWGDVKLMACWGALMGWPYGTMVFFAAAALASAWICVSFFRKKISSTDFLPFGPFINIAGVSIFWWRWYVSSSLR